MNPDATLVFSSVGFATQELVIGLQRTLTVRLQEDARSDPLYVIDGFLASNDGIALFLRKASLNGIGKDLQFSKWLVIKL